MVRRIWRLVSDPQMASGRRWRLQVAEPEGEDQP